MRIGMRLATRGSDAHRRIGRPRGQSVTEFALVLPVLLLILLVGIDVGRVFFGWVNLNNAARIAANFAATHPAGPFTSGTEYYTTVTNDTGGINCASLTVPTPVFAGGVKDVGSTATVTMTCSFGLIVPFVGPIPLGATSVFPVRSGKIAGVPNPPDPPCVAPSIIVDSYVGLKVSVARNLWVALGGTFLPSGSPNKIVIGQVPSQGACANPSGGDLMVATHT